MILLRLYLLAGLVVHKIIWELLKRRPDRPQRPEPPALAVLAKSVKLGILVALVAQAVLPEVLPIMREPRPLRVVGVGLYTLGLCVAVVGRLQLGTNWSDIETPRVLRDQTVVSTGVYRYIRHPIYLGDLLLLLGFELSLNSWAVLAVGFMTPFVVRRAVREERMLAAALPGYDAYCARTKRFVPYVV